MFDVWAGTQELAESVPYAEAVSVLNAFCDEAHAEGASVEYGWASEDNLSAARVAPVSGPPFHVEIVRF